MLDPGDDAGGEAGEEVSLEFGEGGGLAIEDLAVCGGVEGMTVQLEEGLAGVGGRERGCPPEPEGGPAVAVVALFDTLGDGGVALDCGLELGPEHGCEAADDVGGGGVARVEDGGEVDDDGAQGGAVGGFPALAGGARVGVGIGGEAREGSEGLGVEGSGVDRREWSGGLGSTGKERGCEPMAVEGAGDGIEQASVGPRWGGGGEGGDDGFAEKGPELLDFG